MKFNPGDHAILIEANDPFKHLIGSECIIVGLSTYNKGYYIVEFDGFTLDELGRQLITNEPSLRKIDDDTANWEKVEEITGWSPTKEKISE